MDNLDKIKEKMSDKEWRELILIALGTGMTLKEIKDFFNESSPT
ncbi:hypothetical protein ABET51_20545 [Metabacillus fastidiosus]|nr:hypothetical protein [Metabacillus fastidiosus]MEC2078365.1 hypothetical protein [Metabacillus fastidiosus]MED4531201.1 hypothetical protein [Metabacillus fastidiosus]